MRFLLNVNLLGDLSADAGRSPSHCVGPAAPLGCGGPEGLFCRKGRSYRNTVTPLSASISATATSKAERQFAPAPCVRTIPAPDGETGRCSNSSEISISLPLHNSV